MLQDTGLKMYNLEIEKEADRAFHKIRKRDPATLEAVNKKVLEIRENPYHFKPLMAPLQNKRRVHIGCFVLIFEIVEEEHLVKLMSFRHHDDAYN